MRYIIFTRVSTKDQKVANQIKEINLYLDTIKKPEDEIITFEEPETSTRIPAADRPVLQSMLKGLKKGDTLIVYKLDRLARKGRELVDMYDDITKLGVKIYSIQEPTADEEYVHIIAFVAMKERANIRVRTISGLNRKKADMERVGTTWYGYRLDEEKLQLSDERARSYGKPYKLIPDEKEQAAIALMQELYYQDASFQKIADELNSRGFKNRKGKPFQKMSVYQVLRRLEMQSPASLGC